MDDFSLWDQFRACLSCWRKPDIDIDDDDDLQTGRPAGPELDRLLFDSEHDSTDVEADALSLHSNLGISRSTGVRKKRGSRRRGGGKTIRIFGYDLFGRPRAPDVSPHHSEDESWAIESAHTPGILQSDSAPLDPDAAPIPDAAIATLAPPLANAALAKWDAPLTDEQIALEEEQQREKEERRARRAARRLRKQQRVEAEAEAAADLAAGFDIPASHNEMPEFEGFPGGNTTLARDAARPQLESEESEYGPWIGSGQQHNGESRTSVAGTDDSEDDQVDVGGEYNRRSRTSGHSGSGSGSNSRHSRTGHSQTSSIIDGSLYATPSRRTQRGGIPPPHNIPLPPSSAGSSYANDNVPELPQRPSKKLWSARSHSSAARSHGSSSTSQSTSIRSPLGQEFFIQSPGVGAEPQFGDGEDVDVGLVHEPRVALSPISTGFPSAGLGRTNGKRSSFLDGQGAAFARSGF
jgi:hypothetical protein